jgi:effector-binding domain-containing protein/uncharacterized protein YndB with AHSA1/START domain
MKILKVILWVVGILALIYLILCIAGPKKFEASATTTINAPASSIFEEITNFENHPKWSPWHQMDPEMKSAYIGTPGSVGHMETWTSKKMGNGSQEFIEIRGNEYAKTALRFENFDNEPSWVEFHLKPSGESTEVTWSIDGGDYPFLMRGMSFMMPMKKIFEQGVNQLKTLAESKPARVEEKASYEIIDMPAQWYVGKRFPKIAMADINAKLYEDTYGELAKAIGGMDKVAGMPMGIAHGYDGEAQTLDFEIALPVAAEMKVPSGLNCVQIPAGRSAKYIYHGPYEEVEPHWNSFSTDLEKAGVVNRWSTYEVYANDPTTVSSPSEIETWLIQPIQ